MVGNSLQWIKFIISNQSEHSIFCLITMNEENRKPLESICQWQIVHRSSDQAGHKIVDILLSPRYSRVQSKRSSSFACVLLRTNSGHKLFEVDFLLIFTKLPSSVCRSPLVIQLCTYSWMTRFKITKDPLIFRDLNAALGIYRNLIFQCSLFSPFE